MIDTTTARLIATTDAMLATAANRATPAKAAKRKPALVAAILHLFH